MRFSQNLSLIALGTLLIGSNLFHKAHAQEIISEQEAQELGMTRIIDDGQGGLTSKMAKGMVKSSITDEDLNLAEIVIAVNKGVRSSKNPDGQTIQVYQHGKFLTSYITSTGTEKLKLTTAGNKYIATTPTGYFRPKKAYREYQSYTFKGAPMTYAVFFNGGIALHSTTKDHYVELGTRASGGCARMKLEEAKELNALIRSTGDGNTRLLDEGFDGLSRMRYLDRIKLPDIAQYSGEMKTENDEIATYDAVIIVYEPK